MKIDTMKNLICPKCHSLEIIRVPESIQPSILPSSGSRAIKLTRYCCTSCGYTESYVDDTNVLKQLMKRFGF